MRVERAGLWQEGLRNGNRLPEAFLFFTISHHTLLDYELWLFIASEKFKIGLKM